MGGDLFSEEENLNCFIFYSQILCSIYSLQRSQDILKIKCHSVEFVILATCDQMQKEDTVPRPGVNSDRSVFHTWDSSLSLETSRESLPGNEPTQMKTQSRDRSLAVSFKHLGFSVM